MKFSDKKCMALALAVVGAMGFTACNDTLEVLPLEYKEDPNFAPPHINPAWNLVEVDAGLAGNGVYAYKDKLYDGLFTRTLGDAATIVGMNLGASEETLHTTADDAPNLTGAVDYATGEAVDALPSTLAPGQYFIYTVN